MTQAVGATPAMRRRRMGGQRGSGRGPVGARGRGRDHVRGAQRRSPKRSGATFERRRMMGGKVDLTASGHVVPETNSRGSWSSQTGIVKPCGRPRPRTSATAAIGRRPLRAAADDGAVWVPHDTWATRGGGGGSSVHGGTRRGTFRSWQRRSGGGPSLRRQVMGRHVDGAATLLGRSVVANGDATARSEPVTELIGGGPGGLMAHGPPRPRTCRGTATRCQGRSGGDPPTVRKSRRIASAVGAGRCGRPKIRLSKTTDPPCWPVRQGRRADRVQRLTTWPPTSKSVPPWRRQSIRERKC